MSPARFCPRLGFLLAWVLPLLPEKTVSAIFPAPAYFDTAKIFMFRRLKKRVFLLSQRRALPDCARNAAVFQ